jgi:nicotinate-nucleotide adenylyltransferase
MAHAAFDDLVGVEVSDLELRRSGPTYTIDTVEELVAAGDTVILFVGADTAASMPTWHRSRDLARLVDVGVIPREGTTVELPDEWRRFDVSMDGVDLSSSVVRHGPQDPLSLSQQLPAGVIPRIWPLRGSLGAHGRTRI